MLEGNVPHIHEDLFYVRLLRPSTGPPQERIEMTWPVFGGDFHELYMAVLKARCVRDGLGTDSETLNSRFRLHLHRGISYLATPNKIRGIGDLVGLGEG